MQPQAQPQAQVQLQVREVHDTDTSSIKNKNDTSSITTVTSFTTGDAIGETIKRFPEGLVASVQCAPDKWFDLGLVSRGASKVVLQLSSFFRLGKNCCGVRDCVNKRGSFHHKHLTVCPRHTEFIQRNVFAQCRTCEFFYFGDACYPAFGVALHVPNRTQKIIIGGSSRMATCGRNGHPLYNMYLNMGDAGLADAILVDSGRTPYLSSMRSKALAEKMLLVGESWKGWVVTDAELARRRAFMEMRWRSGETKNRYIVTIGVNYRDYATLFKAARGLGVLVYVLARGKKVPLCTSDVPCNLPKFLVLEEYNKLIAGALFVAIPTKTGVHDGGGITALYEALMNGKIVILTDTGVHMHDHLVYNGSNGFMVGYQDIAGWRRTMKYLLQANTSTLRGLERKAFDVGASFSQESVIEKFMTRVNALRSR